MSSIMQYIHQVSTLLGIYYFFFFFTYWSPASVAYPLTALMYCVFRDALLHSAVVMCSYVRYCHLPASFDQSGPLC